MAIYRFSFSEVKDVVKATMFLLSDNSAMISGTVLPIDGGLTGTV